MTRPAALSGLMTAISASALLAGCAAFNLGPDTDAARAANEAVRGYPRLVDVPPEPVDMHCLRQALAWPDSAAGISTVAAAAETGRAALSRADLTVFEPPVMAPLQEPRRELVQPSRAQARFNNLLSSVRSLSRLGRGGDEEQEYRVVTPRAPCPPPPGEEMARLLAARAYVEGTTIDIRADRPAAADDAGIALPEDLGDVARAGEGPEATR